MRVLVTGGAGFIGAHIVRNLINDPDIEFVASMDDYSGGQNALFNMDIIEHDKLNICVPWGCQHQEAMESIYSQGGFDTLVHCAANAREGASQFQPISVTQRNFDAYIKCLTGAIQHDIKNVVLFSSMSVYGHGTKEPPFDESQDAAPTDVYAVNKHAMEETTKILSDVHGFNYNIIRPHNVFGEYQALHDRYRNVVGIFMNLIMRGDPITIYGDGEQTRAFSYIDDSLPAFIKMIKGAETYHGETVNIGGIVPDTVNHLAEMVCEAMGVPDHPIEYYDDRPREVKHAFSSYDKSVELLGYNEDIGYEDGIRRMAEWAKEQGPQEWETTDKLEIINDKTPRTWID